MRRAGSARVGWFTCDDRGGMSRRWRGLTGATADARGALRRDHISDDGEATG